MAEGMRALVLASTSVYRRQLLQRLQLAFTTAAPHTDETPIIGEPPCARALRLAEEKARAVSADFSDAVIIGGDQTIADGETLFDKPGTADNAVAQLCGMRGRRLIFYTAVALADGGGKVVSELVIHRARFREAGEDEIRRYVQKEDATRCAGGAQIEGLGIALLADISGGDPTALIGLPLMVTAQLLRAKGFSVP